MKLAQKWNYSIKNCRRVEEISLKIEIFSLKFKEFWLKIEELKTKKSWS